MIELIGQGSYGNVYKAVHVPSQTVVAIKEILIAQDTMNLEKVLIMITRELEILYKMSKFPNNGFTIQLLDVLFPAAAEADPNKLSYICLVTDYYQLNLQEVLANPERYAFNEK